MSRSPSTRFFVLATLILGLLSVASCSRRSMPTSPSGVDATGIPTSSFEQGPNGHPLVEGQAIVTLRSGTIEDFASAHHLLVEDALTIDGQQWYLVSSSQNPLATDLAQTLLNNDPLHVLVSEANSYIEMPVGEPMATDGGGGFRTGEDYATQDAVGQVERNAAHRIATGQGVKIAVLDTGLDPTHPAFDGANVRTGLDYTQSPPHGYGNETQDGLDTDRDGNKDEAYGHGTHVAGIIHLAAPGAELVAMKVLDDDGWGTAWGITRAVMEAADDEQANVINLSLSLPMEVEALHKAIGHAQSNGVVLVAAAGNHGSNMAEYPAAWNEVISVTAVDRHDELADFANWHSTVDLSAPGVDITSAIPAPLNFGDYALASGGSMAAAWVSGGAALVLEAFGPEPPSSVAKQLRNSGVDIDPNNPGRLGTIGRRLNLFGAVSTSDPNNPLNP